MSSINEAGLEISYLISLYKGLSIKDVRTQGRGYLSSVGILRTRGEGVLQMRTSALFGSKTLDFSKPMVCPHC